MKYFRFAGIVVALVALAACGQLTQPDVETVGQEIVITGGAAAPAVTPTVRPLSDFASATASLGGSTANAVALKPSTCSEGSSQTVTITYTVTGRQAHPASFNVRTNWEYNGTWVGSNAATVNVPAREAQDAATVRTVDLTITNASATNSGASSFSVLAEDQTTSSPAALNFAGSNVTINVEFSACSVINTAPWLTVPEDFTVAAQDGTGVVVDFANQVTFGDEEDAVEDLALVCAPSSGTRFPLGPTVVTCRVTDSGDLFTEESFTITVEDQTPPVFAGIAGPYTVVATSLAGWALDLLSLNITVSDNVSAAGDIDVNCDETLVRIGVGDFGTVVSCTATDEAGNESDPANFRVNVALPNASEALNGGVVAFRPPLRMSAQFSAHKRGSTVPHKIERPMVAGEELVIAPSDLKLVLNVRGTTGEVGQDVAAEPTAASTTWRWDATDQQYIFNLGTSNLTAGTDYWTTVSYRGIILARTTFGVRR